MFRTFKTFIFVSLVSMPAFAARISGGGGSGSVGGGSGSLNVFDGGSAVVTTSSMNFTGAQFVITDSGGQALVTLDASSVTLQGNNLSATYQTIASSGNFIQNRETLQSGATFYVSSGTVDTGGFNLHGIIDINLEDSSQSRLKFDPSASAANLELYSYSIGNIISKIDWYDRNELNTGYINLPPATAANFQIALASASGSDPTIRWFIYKQSGKHQFVDHVNNIMIEFDPVGNSSFTIPAYFVSTMTLSGGYAVQNIAPSSGQVLKFDGTNWAPGTDNNSGGGSALTVATGTASGFTGSFSTATVAINFNSSQFVGQLTGNATAFMGLDTSSVTLQGNSVQIASHASRHQDGGADEISVASLSGLLADPQNIVISTNGVFVATTTRVNFESGSNMTVTATNHASSTTVTFASTASGGGDNLGNHVATKTVTMGFGATVSTLTVTSTFTVQGATIIINGATYYAPSAVCANGGVWVQDGSGGISCGSVSISSASEHPEMASYDSNQAISTHTATRFRVETATTAANAHYSDMWIDLARNGVLTTAVTFYADLNGVMQTVFVSTVQVPNIPYSSGWDGSNRVPTMDALYDKIETLGSASVSTYTCITYVIGGSTTTALPAGTTSFYFADFGFNVSSWTLRGDTTGSIQIDVKACSGDNCDPTVSIAGSELPTLSSARFNKDSALTTWTNITRGQTLGIVPYSASTIKSAILQIWGYKQNP